MQNREGSFLTTIKYDLSFLILCCELCCENYKEIPNSHSFVLTVILLPTLISSWLCSQGRPRILDPPPKCRVCDTKLSWETVNCPSYPLFQLHHNVAYEIIITSSLLSFQGFSLWGLSLAITYDFLFFLTWILKFTFWCW